MELRIKITGNLPLPVNAVEMARLILAVEEKIDALRKLVGDNGGCMVGDGWTVQERKRKGKSDTVQLTLMEGSGPPIVAGDMNIVRRVVDEQVLNEPQPDNLLAIPAFLKGVGGP